MTAAQAPGAQAPASSRTPLPVFCAALLVALAWRPLLYGASAGEVLRWLLFLALWIVLPGWILQRAWLRVRGDGFAQLGIGWTLGLALQALVFLGLRMLGRPEWSVGHPLFVLALAGLGLWRARIVREPVESGPPLAPLRPVHVLLLLVLCVIAVERTTLLAVATWWKDFDRDLFFHAGNAAEFANRWPMRDPRGAASAFNYHVLAYAPAAGARALFGLPTSDVMLRLAASSVPVLLALQLFNAGRSFGGSARAGLIASALVVLSADVGFQAARVLGELGHALSFNSFLGFGVFNSPSTSLGLVYTVTIALVLRPWFGRETAPRLPDVLLLLLLGCAASGTKGSVMPVVLAGLGALFVLQLATRRPGAWRALVALVLLALASLPMTLALTQGEASFGPAMFRLAPLHALRESGAFAAAARVLGKSSAEAPVWLGWALLPVWMVGYFGLAGACALVWFARSWRSAGAAETWIALCGLCATVIALLLGAPGYSQLFFLYTGQVGLALLAAMALDRGMLPRRALIAVAIVLGLPLLLAAAIAIAGEVRRDLRRKEPQGISAAYYAGLAWIRAHTPEDAILVARHGEMLESVHAERASFQETEQYTPAAHARGWTRGPSGWLWSPDYTTTFPERRALRTAFFAHPDASTIAGLRGALPGVEHVYALFDALETRYGGELGSWFEVAPVGPPPPFDPALMTLVFENEALRVYRLEQVR